MEKMVGQVTFTETDDGFRIDVKGKTLEDMCTCCLPMMASCFAGSSCCCSPSKEKK